MKKILVLCVVMALGGCAQYDRTYAGHDHAVPLLSGNIITNSDRYDQAAKELERQQIAGDLTPLDLSKGLLALQQKYIPEETAYGMYLSNRQDAAQKLADGKISKDQYLATDRHLEAEYQNEMAQRRAGNAERNESRSSAENYYRAAIGAQMINNINQNYQRNMRPIAPMVNCTSSTFGGVVSTSCY